MRVGYILFSLLLLTVGHSRADNFASKSKGLGPLKNIVSAPERIQDAAKSVVLIAHPSGDFGTGFFVNETGLLATNVHVVGPQNCSREGCYLTLYKDYRIGSKFETIKAFAVPQAIQSDIDLAFYQILSIDNNGVKEYSSLPLKMASKSSEVGDKTYVVGHPVAGLQKWTHERTYRKVGEWCHSDHCVLGGSSGSPVLNESGEWVGIVHRRNFYSPEVLDLDSLRHQAIYSSVLKASDTIKKIEEGIVFPESLYKFTSVGFGTSDTSIGVLKESEISIPLFVNLMRSRKISKAELDVTRNMPRMRIIRSVRPLPDQEGASDDAPVQGMSIEGIEMIISTPQAELDENPVLLARTQITRRLVKNKVLPKLFLKELRLENQLVKAKKALNEHQSGEPRELTEADSILESDIKEETESEEIEEDGEDIGQLARHWVELGRASRQEAREIRQANRPQNPTIDVVEQLARLCAASLNEDSSGAVREGLDFSYCQNLAAWISCDPADESIFKVCPEKELQEAIGRLFKRAAEIRIANHRDPYLYWILEAKTFATSKAAGEKAARELLEERFAQWGEKDGFEFSHKVVGLLTRKQAKDNPHLLAIKNYKECEGYCSEISTISDSIMKMIRRKLVDKTEGKKLIEELLLEERLPVGSKIRLEEFAYEMGFYSDTKE